MELVEGVTFIQWVRDQDHRGEPTVSLSATTTEPRNGAEAVRIGTKAGVGPAGIATIWRIFPTLHASHAAGVWSGLLQYLRKPDWTQEPERIPPRKAHLRAV